MTMDEPTTIAPRETTVIDLTGSWVLNSPYSISSGDVELEIEHLANGIGVIAPVGWRVHIPTHSGVRYVHIPEGWSAKTPLATRCVIFENGRTFLNLTCREPDYAPVELEITSEGGRCRVNWEFLATQQSTFRILAFESWEALIDDHRDWMRQAGEARSVRDVAPGWLVDCPLLVYVDIETINSKALHHEFSDVSRLAARLAELDAPPNTMVYLTTWNEGGERSWPTYEPSRRAGGLDGLRAAADALHERGFRLMLHANVWGVSPIHPEYTSMSSAVVHNRAGHPLGWREFHRDYVSDYFYVRPDSKVFQSIFWGSLAPVVEALSLDALYLDQAGLLVDDPLVDLLEATRQLIGVIKADQPELVLGGQVLNSRLCHELVLWQLWGTPWSGHGWGQPFRRRSPIIADLFRDLTRFCAHIHVPAAVPGHYLWTHERFAEDLGLVGGFLAAQEDNSYHGAIPSVRLNFRDHGIDPLSFEVIQHAARWAARA